VSISGGAKISISTKTAIKRAGNLFSPLFMNEIPVYGRTRKAVKRPAAGLAVRFLKRIGGPCRSHPETNRFKEARSQRMNLYTDSRGRVAAYLSVSVLLLVGYTLLRDSPWQGTKELHTIMEIIATLLASAVGILALLRFYSQKNNTILFIGTAFLGTAFLDGYHAIVTSSFLTTISLRPLLHSSRGVGSPPACFSPYF
jgi:hypothetical protein